MNAYYNNNHYTIKNTFRQMNKDRKKKAGQSQQDHKVQDEGQEEDQYAHLKRLRSQTLEEKQKSTDKLRKKGREKKKESEQCQQVVENQQKVSKKRAKSQGAQQKKSHKTELETVTTAERSKSNSNPTRNSQAKSFEKEDTMHQMQRYYARISRKRRRKSNFYLDRQDSLRWGEPVGRGSKKLREKMEEERRLEKQREKQRKKRQKEMVKQLCMLPIKKEPVKVEQPAKLNISAKTQQPFKVEQAVKVQGKSANATADKQQIEIVEGRVKSERDHTILEYLKHCQEDAPPTVESCTSE